MEIINELNKISKQLETAFETENWDRVDEAHDQLQDIMYQISDSDLLSVNTSYE